MMALIISEAAHGKISSPRAIRRPGNCRLSASATGIEISVVMPTTTTVHGGLRETRRKTGSEKSAGSSPTR